MLNTLRHSMTVIMELFLPKTAAQVVYLDITAPDGLWEKQIICYPRAPTRTPTQFNEHQHAQTLTLTQLQPIHFCRISFLLIQIYSYEHILIHTIITNTISTHNFTYWANIFALLFISMAIKHTQTPRHAHNTSNTTCSHRLFMFNNVTTKYPP